MILTSKNVQLVVRDCLFTDAETNGRSSEEMLKDPNMVLADGIMSKMVFNKTKLEKHTADIVDMLSQLPEGFNEDVGGGWSFLAACDRRDGVQWGEHRDMDFLFVLGTAIGKVRLLMAREMWEMLPGGMPYYAICK